MIGEELDKQVREYIRELRKLGCSCGNSSWNGPCIE